MSITEFRRWAVDVFRQWPWIFPRGIEYSITNWISKRHRSVGWYRALRDAWIVSIKEGGLSVFPPPNCSEHLSRRQFVATSTRTYPPATVCMLKNANLVSDEGMVLTSDNRLLSEYYHEFSTRSIRQISYGRPFLYFRTKVQRVEDPIALLAAPQASNHYHWIFDVLPRIEMLEQFRPIISRYAVPCKISDIQIESLEILGVASDKLIKLEKNSRMRLETLYLPSLLGSEGSTPPWVLQFLEERFIPAASNFAGHGSLVYLRRGDGVSRPILNEDELMHELERRGYKSVVMSNYSMREQISIMRDARIIVAAHGAALANLAFTKHAAVLELFSGDYLRPDCFFTLCRQKNLRYDFWVDTTRGITNSSWGAIKVNVREVLRKLRELESGVAS